MNSYPTAAIPEPFQILGLRLKPFCLGHWWLMERFGVAFTSKDETNASLHDLVLGVLICSMTYEDFVEFLEKPDAMEVIGKWGYDCGAFDLAEKVKLFSQYLEAALKQPVVLFEREGAASGAHWTQAVMLVLTGALGYTAKEARNLPLSQAFADFYRHAETLGVVSICDENMAQMIEEAEKSEGGFEILWDPANAGAGETPDTEHRTLNIEQPAVQYGITWGGAA